MLDSFIKQNILTNFQHTPTAQQNELIDKLAQFTLATLSDTTFLLKGYAGTGKTSLVSALVKTLLKLKQKVVLLAPTGRAAKVLSNYAEAPAFTIHKKLFRLSRFGADNARYELANNLYKNTYFIVDEASMISNVGDGGNVFGTGCLLDDLIHYVFSGENCKLMLIGDNAQLPPVGEEYSPALSTDQLLGYGLNLDSFELTDVVRQNQESGILYNATILRQMLAEDNVESLPKFRVKDFEDIVALNGSNLIEELENSYSKVGKEEAIVICRSNKRANLYNQGIRNSVFYYEEELSSGDLLIINKNNYFWAKEYKEMEFIANGEIVRLVRVSSTYELYGFRFADVTIAFPDYNEYEMDVKLILNTLYSETPSLSRIDQEKLFYAVMEDYAELPTKRERIKKIKEDAHFNALQVKFAYAVTGHKAQGGQWKHVYLDQGYISEEYVSSDYFRWLYTALTRASEKLFLVNYPKDQLDVAE